jgi:hypothetical protein
MSSTLPDDVKLVKLQGYAKVAGTVAVVGAASAAVVVVGASLVTASVVAVVGLVMVNFVVPVTARSVALWRVKALTKMTEAFSEETIREDEQKEAERIAVLEDQYSSSCAELEGAQEEISKQLKTASLEEQEMLNGQINAIQAIIQDAEDTLRQRKIDFVELQRINKLYIALHRSAKAMEKAHGAERNPEELQRIEVARTSIKSKMRQAMAGKTIDSMNLAINKPTSLTKELSHMKIAKKEGSTSV